MEECRDAKLNTIIAEERLRPDETRAFVNAAFHDGEIREAGIAITRILPPVSRFTPEREHATMKQRVLDQLRNFFDRFFGLLSTGEGES